MPACPHACVQVRCANVNAFFTYSLYKNICRGLFEKSKLLFSFTLCIKLMAGDNRINTAELRFLLAGATSTDTRLSNPASDWLVESSWLDLSDLAKLPALLASWRAGEEGGAAIVNLLMGDANPSGKLAQAWQRSAGYIHTPTSPW